MKKSRVHTWNESEIPRLRDHSEAKHEILSEYIQKYLSIVCQSRFIEKFDLTLVDGFAGGGKYQNEKKGSPLIMIESVEKAKISINLDRNKHINICAQYFFIEKDPDNYKTLEQNLDEFGVNYNETFPILGDFNNHIKHIIDLIKIRNPRNGGGAIFFLDQDGYSDVNISTLKLIRKELDQAEIIININIGWLIDFIDDSLRFKSTINNLGLSGYLDVEEIIKLKTISPDNRYIIESRLSKAIQKATSFPYFRPFFIEPQHNHRGYWLLHLSPHHMAHNAMNEVIWQKGNCMRHYGGDGTRIFDLSYKGGIPKIFGQIFNGQSHDQHINGLIRDIPGIIWDTPNTSVNRLIENTCNNTAASCDMYLKSISRLKDEGEILIRGKSGGKKRTNVINRSDIIIPNKQTRIIFKKF